MIVLGIDTSAVTCSVALYSDRLLSSFTVSDGLTHSQTLLPGISKVLDEGGVSISQLDLVSVSAGPGSFTGLRIGISTVKGLCIARKIPCVGVSTLEALATNARLLEGSVVCPVMDARRGEFYNALFRIENGLPIRLTPDRAICGEKVSEEIRNFDNLVVLGDGAKKFVQQNPDFERFLAEDVILHQNGESVALLGIRMADKEMLACQKLSPSYLRLPQAEREWLKKNNNL